MILHWMIDLLSSTWRMLSAQSLAFEHFKSTVILSRQPSLEIKKWNTHLSINHIQWILNNFSTKNIAIEKTTSAYHIKEALYKVLITFIFLFSFFKWKTRREEIMLRVIKEIHGKATNLTAIEKFKTIRFAK